MSRLPEDRLYLLRHDPLEPVAVTTPCVAAADEDSGLVEPVANRRFERTLFVTLVGLQLRVRLCLLREHLLHPHHVPQPFDRRGRNLHGHEDVFAAVPSLVGRLPRVHLLGHRVGTVGDQPDADCVELRRGRPVDVVEDRVLEPEGDPTLAIEIDLVATARREEPVAPLL